MAELQDIIREFGPAYRETHSVPIHQQKVMDNIKDCRTSALGGHIDQCEDCGHIHISYNSCRDRHCPKCQSLKREQWVSNREQELLEVGYFHVVFTIPAGLNPLVLSNQKEMYTLLFSAVSGTLVELAADPKYLGAQIGVISVLHTWGQNLMFHPHIHCIVPGGGLSTNGLRFVFSRKKFFIPVRVLSQKFRGKFLGLFKEACDNGKLKYESPSDPGLRHLIDELYQTDWVVYCKAPFKNPAYVLRYLGRYTHRVAISNHRIVSVQDDHVTFKWRDYKDNHSEKLMSISVFEFIRRFLLHVLPLRYVKIRYYGFMSNRTRRIKIKRCQKLLGMSFRPVKVLSNAELILKLTGINPLVCSCCGGPIRRRVLVNTGHSPP